MGFGSAEDWKEAVSEGDATMAENPSHDLPKDERSNKYGNSSAVSSDGYRFDSKLERDVYERLLTLKEAGEIDLLLRQTRIDITPDTRMRVDFTVFWSDGSVQFLDAKGHVTDVWRTKQSVVEDRKGIRIETISREDLDGLAA